MASDFWKELEQDLQEEYYWGLWRRFRPFVFTGMAFVIVGAACVNVWQRSEDVRKDYAYTLYTKALHASPEQAGVLWKMLEHRSWRGYKTTARLYEFIEEASAIKDARLLKDWGSLQAKARLLLAKIKGEESYEALIHLVVAYVGMALFVKNAEIFAPIKKLLNGSPAWHPLAIEVLLMQAYASQDKEEFTSWMHRATTISLDKETAYRLHLLGTAMGIPLKNAASPLP